MTFGLWFYWEKDAEAPLQHLFPTPHTQHLSFRWSETTEESLFLLSVYHKSRILTETE